MMYFNHVARLYDSIYLVSLVKGCVFVSSYFETGHAITQCLNARAIDCNVIVYQWNMHI